MTATPSGFPGERGLCGRSAGPRRKAVTRRGNIGTRPTVAGIRQQLEVHLLDVAMDLYGRHIQVVLRKKIRNEQRFASLDELKAQIARDELTAREFFGLTKPA